MRVAGGHERQTEVVGDVNGPLGAAALDIEAVVLNLHVEISAEDFREPNCRFAGLVQLIEQDVIAELTGRAPGKTDDSLAVRFENFFIDARDVMIAFEVGDHSIPRIDKEVLEAHSKGIICLSGCASSEFSDYILLDQLDKAREAAVWFSKIFGANFYVEIQNNGLDIQRRCAEGAIDIANDLGLPCVATSDAHYLKQEDHFGHDVPLSSTTAHWPKAETR